MSFYISCTNCGQKLEAEEEHIGHKVPCPVCNETIYITKPIELNVEEPVGEETEPKNDKKKFDKLKNKTKAAIDKITNSEQDTELKENLKVIRKRGKDAAISAADTLSKSGKIAALQAKIKKIESIDLKRALQELGEKCFRGGTIQIREPDIYIELERLRKEIDECNDKELPKMATLGGKEQVQRLALKAKLKIKEEKLKGEYRSKLIELGEKGSKSEEAREQFKDLIQYINLLISDIKDSKDSINQLGKGVHYLFTNPWIVITTVIIVIGFFSGIIVHHKSHTLGGTSLLSRQSKTISESQVGQSNGEAPKNLTQKNRKADNNKHKEVKVYNIRNDGGDEHYRNLVNEKIIHLQQLQVEDGELVGPIVKGVQLGMDIRNAHDAMKDALKHSSVDVTDLQVGNPTIPNKKEIYYFNIISPSHGSGNSAVEADENGKVISIGMNGEFGITDDIFGTSALDANEFAKMFIDNYNIPKLEPESYGWSYVSEDGCKISIGTKKGVLIKRVLSKTESEKNFN